MQTAAHVLPLQTFRCQGLSWIRFAAILNHYEPQIVKASIRTVNMPNGSKQRIIDQDIKTYIQSELAMKIMVKYDLNKKPTKRCPPQNTGSSNIDMTG